jgi:hypothetical protein
MWCEGLRQPGWAGSRVRKGGWVVRAGDVPGFSGAAGSCWLMPRRAGDRAGDRAAACRRGPHGGRRPAGPQPVPLAPAAPFFAHPCGTLDFSAVDPGSVAEKGVLQCTGSTAKPGSTTIFGRPGTPGCTRPPGRTLAPPAAGIRPRQEPTGSGSTRTRRQLPGEEPSGVMPGVPPGPQNGRKWYKPGTVR